MIDFAKIVALSILAAITYGIIHDQITARICVEYFTIGHPPVFDTDSPTLLAFGWGIIATWWVGAGLGLPLAVAARVGAMPKISAKELLKPLGLLLAFTGSCAFIAGITGYILATRQILRLETRFFDIPAAKHTAFLTDLWIHNASYIFGSLGGIGLIISTWKKRVNLLNLNHHP